MLTRRQFLEKTIHGVSAGAAIAASEILDAGQLAWSKPIGLEIYTVRAEFAKDPAGTLKKVGATGYREVEVSTEIPADTLKAYLRAANLTAPSTYLDVPKDIESWKKTLDRVHPNGFRYIVVGDNPQLDAEAWKRRAELFNECDASGYDIMLTRSDPELLKMEMDVFWATYAGQDPLDYFQKYPGRFPLLHIKDFKPGFPTSTASFPYDSGPNPFAPAGKGRIDWVKIFAHARQAGTQHIFVEQDRCDGSPFEAITASFNYLKNLRLS